MYKKILVIKFMHIGDVLLITPLLKNLKHHFPHAKIDVALNEGTQEMISNHPAVDHIHVYQRSSIKRLPFIKRFIHELYFIRRIRREKYDLVINLTRGDRGIVTSIFSGADTIISFPSDKNVFFNHFIGHPITSSIQHKHWVDINLKAIKILGKEIHEKKVEIFWPTSIEEKIKNLLHKYQIKQKEFIHFHPVSRWLFKCIDDNTSAAIIDFCQKELGLPVLITAAPVDEELDKIKKILILCKTTPINLSGSLTLKETAALNRQSLAYIGVDTSIMHISAANDIPVLAFFGPSLPYAWGPWDNDSMESGYHCLRGNQQMGKHCILQKKWPCVPCDRKGCNNSGISDCLIQMDFDEIKKHIVKVVKEGRENGR